MVRREVKRRNPGQRPHTRRSSKGKKFNAGQGSNKNVELINRGQVKDNHKLILANIGNYIILNGKGLIDGLKQKPTKFGSLKIIGIDNDGALTLKQHRRRTLSSLPEFNQNQDFAIITKKQFSTLGEFE